MFSVNYKRPKTAKVVSSSTNIPTSFSTASGSKVLTGLANNGYNVVQVINTTSTDISMESTDDESGTPSSSSTKRIFIPAGYAIVLDQFPIFNNIFIQSEGSTISSGTVYINVY